MKVLTGEKYKAHYQRQGNRYNRVNMEGTTDEDNIERSSKYPGRKQRSWLTILVTIMG
jgi:hypothetical protein